MHVELCQPFMIGQQSGATLRSTEQPVPTIATGGAISLIQPFITELHGGKDANSIGDPRSRVTTKGAHHGLVEPFVLSREHRGGQPPFVVPVNHGSTKGGNHRVYDVNNPMPTITALDDWGMVQPYIIAAGGPVGQGRHPRDINEPLPTILTDDCTWFIQPYLVEYRGSYAGRRTFRGAPASITL